MGTDPRVEQLDVVNPATGIVTGTGSRFDVHRQGLWHQVFHCLVLRPAGRSVILQRRAATKAAFPLKLDLTVTGHLETGEQPSDGCREMAEELGVPFAPTDLIPIGTRLLADDGGEGHNRELVHVHFALADRPLTSYRPPVHEVDGLVELSAEGLAAILTDDRVRRPARSASALEPEASTEITVGRHDLVPGNDGYWTVLAVMAERALDNSPLLGI